MSDYPDYTSLLQIIGSDIMVPIDLQGAYIMMPVDIQAQYVTLDIDIVAQSVGNISIDIAAQSIGNLTVNIAASAITLDINIASSAVTLNVDIAAQTIGNLTIDIKAQSVAVFTARDWAASIGLGLNVYAQEDLAGNASGNAIDVTVPTGKVCYVDDLFVSGVKTAAVKLSIGGTTILFLFVPALDYLPVTFSISKKATAGQHIIVWLENESADAASFYATIGYRQVDA